MEQEQFEYFTFFRSYYETAKGLTPEERGIFWGNLMAYIFEGKEPQVSGMQWALFLCTRPHLDASLRKMEAGRKGGASKGQGQSKQGESNKRTKEQKNKEQKNAEPKDKGQDLPPPSPQGGRPDWSGAKGFEVFWQRYPKRTGKSRALMAWLELEVDAALAQSILAALEVLKAGEDWRKEEGRYVPAPEQFLLRRDWELVEVGNDPSGPSGDLPIGAYTNGLS